MKQPKLSRRVSCDEQWLERSKHATPMHRVLYLAHRRFGCCFAALCISRFVLAPYIQRSLL